MTEPALPLERLSTGSAALDAILGGGIPAGSVTVVAGEPGSGKTVFTLQALFHHARQGRKCLYFTTLSEPALKVIRYMQLFSFFDSRLIEDRIIFADLGSTLRSGGVEQALAQMIQRVEGEEPDLVAVDSFKAIHDLLPSDGHGRIFVYDLAVSMAAWGATTLLVGEYAPEDIGVAPEFAIADGIVRLSTERQELTTARQLEVLKLRGANYVTGRHFFEMGADGLTFYPRVRGPEMTVEPPVDLADRVTTGVSGLDALLLGGLPRASATMVEGGTGTGKTLLGLHFLLEGARRGEPGILFTLEETPAQIRAIANNFGWKLAPLEAQGRLLISYTSPVELFTDRFLDVARRQIERVGARHAVLDSLTSMALGVPSPAPVPRAGLRPDQALPGRRGHAADDHGGRGAARRRAAHRPRRLFHRRQSDLAALRRGGWASGARRVRAQGARDRPRHGAPPLQDRRPRGARRRAVRGSARGADRGPPRRPRRGASRRAALVRDEESGAVMPHPPDPVNLVGSVARTLYDIGQSFDSPLDPEPRLRRALGLLRRIVPYDRCALLEAPAAGPARLVVEPDVPEARESLSRVLTRFLTVVTDESQRGADWLPPDVAHLVPSASHLAIPLVGLDRVLGVLFVSHQEADAYTDDHLRLLSVVASQIAAYLTACRLREQEVQIASEHEAARAAAEAENRAKDEFLAMLAHELRNPLTAIGIAMQTIRGQAERDPIVQLARDVVERQVKHLARLLDDLLDVSRLTRGKIELHKETVTLQMVVAAALETTRGFIDARRHVESMSLPAEPLWFEADPARITQVVGNLLDNAAKYTPRGGKISVTGYRERGEIVLRVRDTGIGISPEMLPRVFDLFVQADRSLAGSEGGLGVGLTLARTLVELHGGNDHRRERGAGPRERVRGAPAGRRAGRAPGRGDSRRAAVQPRHVLLVEDNDDIRDALRTELEFDGHRVDAARDGPRGVELALATVPQVALIDLGLPGLDGYEVGRRIRAALGRRVFLVALTDDRYRQERDRRRSSEAGFDAHLVKPVSHEDLTRVLGRAAGGDG